jgi:hypothetical protein
MGGRVVNPGPYAVLGVLYFVGAWLLCWYGIEVPDRRERDAERREQDPKRIGR